MINLFKKTLINSIVKHSVYYYQKPIVPNQKDHIHQIEQIYTNNRNKYGIFQNLTVLSRIAHLNNSKQYHSNPVVKQIIDDFLKFNIRRYSEHKKKDSDVRKVNIVTRMVKYAAIINIQDQRLWKKLTINLNYLDFKNSLSDLVVLVNYLYLTNKLGRNLRFKFREIFQKIYDSNYENYSVRVFTDLLRMNQVLQLDEEYKHKINSKIKLMISNMNIIHLKNNFAIALRQQQDDQEVWNLLIRFTQVRIKDISKSVQMQKIVMQCLGTITFNIGLLNDTNLQVYEKSQQEMNFLLKDIQDLVMNDDLIQLVPQHDLFLIGFAFSQLKQYLDEGVVDEILDQIVRNIKMREDLDIDQIVKLIQHNRQLDHIFSNLQLLELFKQQFLNRTQFLEPIYYQKWLQILFKQVQQSSNCKQKYQDFMRTTIDNIEVHINLLDTNQEKQMMNLKSVCQNIHNHKQFTETEQLHLKQLKMIIDI